MKMNKFLGILAIALLLLGVTACGAKQGVVSYANVESIVVKVEANIPENISAVTGSSYNEVITLLGAPTDAANLAFDSKTGYLVWSVEGEYTVRVDFVTNEVTAKTSEGLYESIYKTPIGAKTGAWEWIIQAIGWFTLKASSLFGLLSGYYYWIGLLIMTLTIRTLAWPVYAKSNDLTLKMQMAQPEITKIQEKYQGRTDQATQQRMQLETMDVYKKYKINLLGCLMPFVQMPIFIAMYQVVQRFPLSGSTFFGLTNADMNISFLWTNLGNIDWLPNLPLAIIVAFTMWLSQYLTQKRTANINKNQRYMSPQQQQSQKTMKYMMYFMVVMMGYISILNAGIAYYWIIGNLYQLFQSYISHRNTDRRQDQLRKQF